MLILFNLSSIKSSFEQSELQIILNFYQVKGFEILVPSASFITDVSAIKWCGGTPVYVDINPKTLSFDLDNSTQLPNKPILART